MRCVLVFVSSCYLLCGCWSHSGTFVSLYTVLGLVFVSSKCFCVNGPGPFGSVSRCYFLNEIFICVNGPGPFGSGSRCFCLNKYSFVNGPGPFVWLREPGGVLSEIIFSFV